MNDKSGKEVNYSEHLDRKVITTDDGSSSIVIPGMNEMYHSRKGAIIESKHVYIEHGMLLNKSTPLRILEIGMGTGLNVLLTLQKAIELKREVVYHSLEPYPLSETEWTALNYPDQLGMGHAAWKKIHGGAFGEEHELNEMFRFQKFRLKLEDFDTSECYDIVYFDAFAPGKQQGPWIIENIEKVHKLLNSGGLLTTYCSQGQFKRNLLATGFSITNPEGPMGKREITVAYK